jgi:hypothetical protein
LCLLWLYFAFLADKNASKSRNLSSSLSSSFTPCGAQGNYEELPGVAISSYALDLIP